MKHLNLCCYIYDVDSNLIMRKFFLHRWQAAKWATKEIIKRNKLGKWYYYIIKKDADYPILT